MKFKVDKEIITDWYRLVAKGSPGKTSNPILKTVLIEAANNMVSLRTTNGIMEVSARFPAAVEEEGSCCVDSFLFTVVNNFSAGDILFSKKKTLTIRQGNRSHRYTYVEAEEFPDKLVPEGYEAVDVGSVVSVFKKCSPSVLRISSGRPVLENYFINPHDQYVVSSDGDRISYYKDVTIPGNNSIVPANFLDSIIPFLDEEEDSLEICSGTLFGMKAVRGDAEWEMILSSFVGYDYPDVVRTLVLDSLEATPTFTMRVKREELLSILYICSSYYAKAVSEGGPPQTILSKNDDGVHFQMEVEGLAKMDEPLPCKTKGADEFSIWFHGQSLFEAVKLAIGDKLKFKFFGDDKPFIMLDKSDSIYMQTCMGFPRKGE